MQKTGAIKNTFTFCFGIASLMLVLNPGILTAQTAVDEDAPWPRVFSTNGNTVTFHLPQVESWTSNWFTARTVVEVKPARVKKTLLGVIWFEANGTVDRSNRLVTLDRLTVTRGRFPEAKDNGSNALALVREVFPTGARTVSFDYLITALGFEQAAARAGAQGLNHTPPEVLWVTNRTVLILVDGEPVFRPITGLALERVINTPALMVRDPANGQLYLSGDGRWFAAPSVNGPWSLVQSPPVAVAALSPTNSPPATGQGTAPRIIVSTKPTELLMTGGLPDFKSISGTMLQYAADSDCQLFFDTGNRVAYLWLSGRWFKATSLQGPWSYVAPRDLPADFAKIPPGSPQAIVLASVPGTPQAELAVLANSVPTTATVSRQDTKIQLTYDGEPKFKPIEGTAMSYAINAQLPVVHSGTNYFALDDAVWFVASSPTGPWAVASEVPEEIYTIPPGSPVYYATFARVYDADTNNVEVGYTAGYTGSYEDDGTTVYGTGYDYESWEGDDYYGWGWSWGYSYWYVPWYGWWVWRPWWNDPYGLRAAVIDNIYDRWQSRPGVTPHDRTPGTPARSLLPQNYSGYPALYGRFKGATGRTSLVPPADTLALNPYTRPKTPLRSGEIPRGAQLLTTVRQTSGGGNDLYASPDGNVYLRRDDGWYRRGSGGNWDFFSPTQGQIERGRIAAAQQAQMAGADGYRVAAVQNAAAARNQARGDRVPNVGGEARAQQVETLERQYYARALGQMRAQNYRASRPARGGGRRR
jgi:hypothetical protein